MSNATSIFIGENLVGVTYRKDRIGIVYIVVDDKYVGKDVCRQIKLLCQYWSVSRTPTSCADSQLNQKIRDFG